MHIVISLSVQWRLFQRHRQFCRLLKRQWRKEVRFSKNRVCPYSKNILTDRVLLFNIKAYQIGCNITPERNICKCFCLNSLRKYLLARFILLRHCQRCSGVNFFQKRFFFELAKYFMWVYSQKTTAFFGLQVYCACVPVSAETINTN